MSWEECQRFCASLSAKVPGLFSRLPTEAEWERACCGGTTGATWLGELNYVDKGMERSRKLDAIAWHWGNSCEVTHPVGGGAANPYGLHDMLGNVWEWCQDWIGNYQAGPATDPVGPGTGTSQILRGGSRGSFAREVRAAYRRTDVPSIRNANLGLRLRVAPRRRKRRPFLAGGACGLPPSRACAAASPTSASSTPTRDFDADLEPLSAWTPSYDIAPTPPVVVLGAREGRRVVRVMRRGLVPHRAADRELAAVPRDEALRPSAEAVARHRAERFLRAG